MTLTRDELLQEAGRTGFPVDSVEKVTRLLELLQTLCSHPYLKTRIALKGGTALNLFMLDLPRLSVDIDLNYIGAADRESMLAEKPKMDQAIQAVCSRIGMQVRRAPTEHAGGKWRLSYNTAMGRMGTLELDVNFMLRTPLWPISPSDSKTIGTMRATGIPVVDKHELVAGKLAALFGRKASRDLFDSALLAKQKLQSTRLRLAFVVYGGINRRDWRTLSIDEIRPDIADARAHLFPLLRADLAPRRGEIGTWCETLAEDCHKLLYRVLPLNDPEIEFLTKLNDHGEIAPELLTGNRALQTVIRNHPGLLWKAQNAKEHRHR